MERCLRSCFTDRRRTRSICYSHFGDTCTLKSPQSHVPSVTKKIIPFVKFPKKSLKKKAEASLSVFSEAVCLRSQTGRFVYKNLALKAPEREEGATPAAGCSELVVKRKRGRPRKHLLPVEGGTQTQNWVEKERDDLALIVKKPKRSCKCVRFNETKGSAPLSSGIRTRTRNPSQPLKGILKNTSVQNFLQFQQNFRQTRSYMKRMNCRVEEVNKPDSTAFYVTMSQKYKRAKCKVSIGGCLAEILYTKEETMGTSNTKCETMAMVSLEALGISHPVAGLLYANNQTMDTSNGKFETTATQNTVSLEAHGISHPVAGLLYANNQTMDTSNGKLETTATQNTVSLEALGISLPVAGLLYANNQTMDTSNGKFETTATENTVSLEALGISLSVAELLYANNQTMDTSNGKFETTATENTVSLEALGMSHPVAELLYANDLTMDTSKAKCETMTMEKTTQNTVSLEAEWKSVSTRNVGENRMTNREIRTQKVSVKTEQKSVIVERKEATNSDVGKEVIFRSYTSSQSSRCSQNTESVVEVPSMPTLICSIPLDRLTFDKGFVQALKGKAMGPPLDTDVVICDDVEPLDLRVPLEVREQELTIIESEELVTTAAIGMPKSLDSSDSFDSFQYQNYVTISEPETIKSSSEPDATETEVEQISEDSASECFNSSERDTMGSGQQPLTEMEQNVVNKEQIPVVPSSDESFEVSIASDVRSEEVSSLSMVSEGQGATKDGEVGKLEETITSEVSSPDLVDNDVIAERLRKSVRRGRRSLSEEFLQMELWGFNRGKSDVVAKPRVKVSLGNNGKRKAKNKKETKKANDKIRKSVGKEHLDSDKKPCLVDSSEIAVVKCCIEVILDYFEMTVVYSTLFSDQTENTSQVFMLVADLVLLPQEPEKPQFAIKYTYNKKRKMNFRYFLDSMKLVVSPERKRTQPLQGKKKKAVVAKRKATPTTPVAEPQVEHLFDLDYLLRQGEDEQGLTHWNSGSGSSGLAQVFTPHTTPQTFTPPFTSLPEESTQTFRPNPQSDFIENKMSLIYSRSEKRFVKCEISLEPNMNGLSLNLENHHISMDLAPKPYTYPLDFDSYMPSSTEQPQMPGMTDFPNTSFSQQTAEWEFRNKAEVIAAALSSNDPDRRRYAEIFLEIIKKF